MKINKAKSDQLLSAIGLEVSQHHIFYDESQFKKYISSEYMNSERFQSDKIYRMFELTLMHKASGLRNTYTTTESYYGEHVDYKVIALFIITESQQQIEIVDVDFNQHVFVTSAEMIPFTEVDRLTT